MASIPVAERKLKIMRVTVDSTLSGVPLASHTVVGVCVPPRLSGEVEVLLTSLQETEDMRSKELQLENTRPVSAAHIKAVMTPLNNLKNYFGAKPSEGADVEHHARNHAASTSLSTSKTHRSGPFSSWHGGEKKEKLDSEVKILSSSSSTTRPLTMSARLGLAINSAGKDSSSKRGPAKVSSVESKPRGLFDRPGKRICEEDAIIGRNVQLDNLATKPTHEKKDNVCDMVLADESSDDSLQKQPRAASNPDTSSTEHSVIDLT